MSDKEWSNLYSVTDNFDQLGANIRRLVLPRQYQRDEGPTAVFVTQSLTRFLSPFHLNLVVVGAPFSSSILTMAVGVLTLIRGEQTSVVELCIAEGALPASDAVAFRS
jgi:hypothetical protein